MAEGNLQKCWIGCVDDDRLFLESTGKVLSRTIEASTAGVRCEVELANGAREFEDLAAEMREEGSELAVLITDQIMPECSGLELIERVKPEHPWTSCVLLTGYAGVESARYAINNRLLDRYVCKPVEDVKTFSELILSELERFQLRRTEALQAAEIERQAGELRIANAKLSRMKSVAECVAYFSRELRTLDLDEVLNLVSERAPALFGAKSSFLFVPDLDGKMVLWRERRVKCLAQVPPDVDINEALNEAMTSRRPVVVRQLGRCSGAIEESRGSQGAVVMPLQLSHRDPAFTGPGKARPAILCLCGIENGENLSGDELEYKVLLINDILGANIANAMAYSETERLARQDSLTGTRTRRVFDDLLRAEWERFRRYESPFCIALMDVDHLKEVNDTHGHAAGDEVLRKVANTAMGVCRRCDTVARYGGDEFALVLPETSPDGARVLVGRIFKELNGVELSFAGAPLQISAGVACSSGRRSAEEVLAAADRALYEAKRRGRNQMCACEGGEYSRAGADPAVGEQGHGSEDSSGR